MTPLKNISTKRTNLKNPDVEFLRINSTKGRVDANLRFVIYRDKDTRQMVAYLPSLEITGYGATEKKAKEMLDFSIEEYFKYITSLSLDKLEIELSKLGWKHDRIKRKEYSKSFIDIDGNLKNLNAVENYIEVQTLVV